MHPYQYINQNYPPSSWGLSTGSTGEPTIAIYIQYIPRNMHTVFALLCFVVVIHWLIFPYPSGLLHWHCGNLTISPVPGKQPWWIWINTLCEFIMSDCITTTKQSTTKQCAYFLGYTVCYDHTEAVGFIGNCPPSTIFKCHICAQAHPHFSVRMSRLKYRKQSLFRDRIKWEINQIY